MPHAQPASFVWAGYPDHVPRQADTTKHSELDPTWPMKVLVADDDATTRTLLCAVLSELGHDAEQAADGGVAWARFQEAKPPLVVLDIEMPDLDGLEVCRRIRSVDLKRETFILVLTGRDHPEDLAAVLDAGADDYVTKPTTVEHLRARFVIADRRSAQDAARRQAEADLAVARWRAGIGEAAIALQHEINNPLAALLGHAELLLMEYKDRGEHNEQAQVVLDQARRIADVVKRIAKLRNPQTVEYIEGARMLDLSKTEER
jgi:DNA-binding response OmpR family regulator